MTAPSSIPADTKGTAPSGTKVDLSSPVDPLTSTSVEQANEAGSAWIAAKYNDKDEVARHSDAVLLQSILDDQTKLTGKGKGLSSDAVGAVKAELEWLLAHPKP